MKYEEAPQDRRKAPEKRYLASALLRDLPKKMLFLAGPRQVGKTTLAKTLPGSRPDRFFNWDFDEDRERILRRSWPSGPGLIVFDEIHKDRKWRNTLKGLFDKRREELQILVTGSARLDFYRYGADSLQGRYYLYRLHPFTVAELGLETQSEIEDLLRLSGFPEPFLSGSLDEKKRWTLQYRSRLVRDDLRDLERVTELGTLERLALRLPDLVGSPLSINSLREDLQVSHPTVARWCEILERLYFIYRLYPFGAPRTRAVKKEAKHYHWDWSLPGDAGARLENLVAGHLLKWCHFETDTRGRSLELRYFRDLDGREVDFVVLEDGAPIRFVECKTSTQPPDRGLRYLKAKFPKVEALQCTLEEGVDRTNDEGIRTLSAIDFLRSLA